MENTHKHKFVGGTEKKCSCGVYARDECVNGHKYAEVGCYVVKSTGSRRCPPCQRVNIDRWKKNNSVEKTDEIKRKNRESSQRLRDSRRKAVFDHYGWRCACCGDEHPEFLTLDHVNGNGREHRRELTKQGLGSHPVYRWVIENGFPEEFQTLCFNCNYAKHVYKTCPHQREFGK